MNFGTRIKIAAAFLLLAGSSLFLQAKNMDEPIINFGISQPKAGIIKSWTPGVSIRVGGQTEVLNGPPGTKALKFTGGDDSVCKFILEGDNVSLRNAQDFSVSFAIRINSQPGTHDDTGLGMHLNGYRFSFGDENFSLPGTVTLKKGQWYQMAFSYSVTRGEARIYVDGVLDNFVQGAKLKKLNIPFEKFGKFDGSLASIQAWDRSLSEKEIIHTLTDDAGLTELKSRIESIETHMKTDAPKVFLDDVIAKISAAKNKRRSSILAQEKISDLGMTALRIAEGEALIRDTSLANAPFALVQVQAVSRQMHVPEKFPVDGVFTATVGTSAAKGEYEPISFMIYAYKPMEKFSIKLTDFTSEKGGKLPASIVDQKIVRHWYKSSWSTPYKSANQVLMPSLLLNDETLIKYDESSGKNFVRVNGKYVDMTTVKPGEKFNFCTEKVEDADTIQPVTLVPGLGKQFWFTFAVPKDAKPGLYKAKATATANGVEVGTFTVLLRVYPFELPAPKTCYNHQRDYLTVLAGSADLSRYASLGGNGEKFFRAELENLKKHNILQPAVQSPSGDKSTFEKDLKIRKDMGFDLKDTFVAVCHDDGNLMTKLPVAGQPATAKISDSDINTVFSVFPKIAGHSDFIFYGTAEADVQNAKNIYQLIASKKGCALTSGWEDDAAALIPTVRIIHASPKIDNYMTEKWHALHGRVISCGHLFAGAGNPDLYRRTFGYKIYRQNYDGFFLPAYPDMINCWNELAHPGPLGNQTLSYPTVNGPINTIAFEGLRDGIDDVRYVTLLRQLLDEAFATNTLEAVYAGKKGVAAFEQIDTNDSDLDVVRMEVADQILIIMKRLGKDIE